MDDFELDQHEPFSPVRVLIVGSLMLVFGLCLISYPAYRIMSSGNDSGAGTLENARPFTCSGCTPTDWKVGDDPSAGPVRPAPKGTGTETAGAPRNSTSTEGADAASSRRDTSSTAASLTATEAPTTPTQAGATASGAPATTTSPPATPAASPPAAPASTAPASTAPPTAPPTAPAPTVPTTTEPRPGLGLGLLPDLLRDLLKGK
jgi:hypothetical protein